MAELLTKAEFASRLGKRPSAVSNWIAREKLTGAALTADGRINVDEALRQLGETIDPGRGNPTAMLAVAAPIDDPPAPSPQMTMPFPGSLADIRLRTETLRLEEMQRNAAIARGELIYAEAAQRTWAEQLEELIASMELFVLDLPAKLGLDREASVTIRAEWRAFRERQADQAEVAMEHGRAA